LFSAFDLDGGGSIDRKELAVFIMEAVIVLCKIVGLTQPSRFAIQEYTYETF